MRLLRFLISRQITRLQFRWIGSPEHVLFFGHGIGDDLLCTSVAHELKRRGDGRIVMFSQHPSLFVNNSDIDEVVNWGYPSVGRLRRWGYNCHILHYVGDLQDNDLDRDMVGNEHILITMCRIAGIRGMIELLPVLNLTSEERVKGRFFSRQGVIQSAGLGLYKNKDWYVDRYQAVGDQLGGQMKLIQLGLATDPLLHGVWDLRGKTSLRESAAILANSHVFIGQVGFLMHLARAVACRGVIIYGGRETPEVGGYTANENMVGTMPCAPCWQRNRCDYNRECMNQIQVDAVVNAALRQSARYGDPLPVDTAVV